MGFSLSNTIITANTGQNSFSALDRQTLELTSKIQGPVESGPHGLTVYSSRQFLYAANSYDRTISVVDCLRGELADIISVGTTPCHLDLCKAKGCLYVTNYDSDSVSVIRLEDLQHILHIPVGRMPHDIQFSQETGLVFTAESGENRVSIIDTEKNVMRGFISLEGAPMHLREGRSGRYLYTVGSSFEKEVQGEICVIDTQKWNVVESYRVGNYLTDLCVDPKEEKIYAADGGLGCIFQINRNNGNIHRCFETGFFPSCLEYVKEEDALLIGDHMTGQIVKYSVKTQKSIERRNGFQDLHHFIIT